MNGLALAAISLLALMSGCTPDKQNAFSGYIEGDWRYLAAPSAGWLEQLSVDEGDQLVAGKLAFRLDTERQDLQVAQAEARQHQAAAQREDLRSGERPQQLAVIEAELDEARSNLKLSALEHQRWLGLVAKKLAATDTADQFTQRWEAAQAQVRTLEAKLASARLGARRYQQIAAEAGAKAQALEVSQAQWQRDQRRVTSRTAGRVERVFYHPGEFVPAGTPVLAILPPDAIRIRFYIPEPQLTRFRKGQNVTVRRDGAPSITARLSYIASEAEYTPPVIYSIENRHKLAFMAKAVPLDPATANTLHPGQPVSVTLP